MKPTTADKPAGAKTTKTSTESRVFDISRPGKGKPSATSRPVIVTNRPMLQDPMVSTTTTSNAGEVLAEPQTSPAAIKLTIKPISVTDDSASSSGTKSSKKDKTVAELAADSAADTSPKTSKLTIVGETPKKTEKAAPVPASSNKDEASSDSSGDAPKPDVALTDTSTDTKSQEASSDTSTKAADSSTTDATAASTPSTDTGISDSLPAEEPAADDADSSDESSDDSSSGDEPKDGAQNAETAALEAEAKQQEAINTLVDSKQYFLPINSVERRRSKLVTLLGVVLIVGLGLLLVDLMLDAGFIRIGGLKALTHFFSA